MKSVRRSLSCRSNSPPLARASSTNNQRRSGVESKMWPVWRQRSIRFAFASASSRLRAVSSLISAPLTEEHTACVKAGLRLGVGGILALIYAEYNDLGSNLRTGQESLSN